jgi:hypothetical protein
MKHRNSLIIMLALILASIPLLAHGQRVFQFNSLNTRLEVLTEETFESLFGNNPDVPRTDAEVIALAEEVYPSMAVKKARLERIRQGESISEGGGERCGTTALGLLMAALQNPAISDPTREEVDRIIRAAIPDLPEKFPSEHFLFHFTSTDEDVPENNVTLAEIESTSAYIERYWEKYTAQFTEPYSDGTKTDVYVYYIGDTELGNTTSRLNRIELNSLLAVKNRCLRRIASAHELFHRVQFSYGLVVGMAEMLWIAEGTADWAEKYTCEDIGEQMSSMSNGLNTPGKALITERSYDASHFWVYLHELTGTFRSIRDVWSKYSANGHDAKKAVQAVTKKRLDKSFDQYVQTWIKANYMKDLSNSGSFDYEEDETVHVRCDVTYGPLAHVPRSTFNVNSNTFLKLTTKVKPYAAAYAELVLDPSMTEVSLFFKGSAGGNFSYHLIPIKGDQSLEVIDSTARKFSFKRTITPGQWDKLALVFAGRDVGGRCTVKHGYCAGGKWQDWSITFNLLETDTGAISGTATTTLDCGDYQVSGSYSGGNITLEATKDNPPDYCCPSFTFTGEPNEDCTTIQGTWHNSCGYTDDFTLQKMSPQSAPAQGATRQTDFLPTSR